MLTMSSHGVVSNQRYAEVIDPEDHPIMHQDHQFFVVKLMVVVVVVVHITHLHSSKKAVKFRSLGLIGVLIMALITTMICLG